mgnify:CR=1 FL=1
MEREDAAPKELSISGYLYFVADVEFNRLLEKYDLKEADYYDRDNPLGIALDRNIEFDRRLEKYVTLDTLKGDGCVIEGLYYVEIDGYYRKDSRIDENGNKVVLYQNRDNENDIIELPYEESIAKYTLRSEKTIEEAPFFVSRRDRCPAPGCGNPTLIRGFGLESVLACVSLRKILYGE